MSKLIPLALSAALLSFASANGVERQVAAAHTKADVTRAMGAPPTCAAEGCTWRSAMPKRSCAGYSCSLYHKSESGERVVTCRVDRDERVSECRTEVQP